MQFNPHLDAILPRYILISISIHRGSGQSLRPNFCRRSLNILYSVLDILKMAL